MSLFACRKCLCVENTACCNYWSASNQESPICSECDPDVGVWHGKFPKRSAVGKLVGNDGFLYTEQPSHIEILGMVQ